MDPDPRGGGDATAPTVTSGSDTPRLPSRETIHAAPKVLLHDHLDGGLRPGTVVELADAAGYEGLPTTDPAEIADWFVAGAAEQDLTRYLQRFEHTVPLMQTEEALHRVAREAAEDLATDNVAYAEIRFAPELHTDEGLPHGAVVDAVLDGLRAGAADTDLVPCMVITAMRQSAHAPTIAELAVSYRDDGVVGFDIAGPEAGYPPTRHLDAFQYCQRESFPITIHAGEAFGLPSIHEAVHYCSAERLGHGVRLVDDITVHDDGVELGELAHWVRDRRIPLEMCPWSNVHTGAAPSIEEHPIDLLHDLQFRVTVNTDNRLMSGTSMTREMQTLVETFGYGLDDLRRLTTNAMRSAFLHYDARVEILEEKILPGYAALPASADPD